MSDRPLSPRPPHALLAARVERGPDRVALRHKELGIWREVTWAGYAAAAGSVAGALHAAGIGAGDRVALAAHGRADRPYARLGAALAGAVLVELDPDATAGEAAAVLGSSGARLVFADDRALDAVLEAAGSCPDLARIVRLGSGGDAVADPRVTMAATFLDGAPPAPAVAVDESNPALVLDGQGALSHGDLAEIAAATAADLGLRGTDELLSHLPASDPGERALTGACHLMCGYVLNLGGGARDRAADLAAVQPTVLYGDRATWEHLHRDAESRLAAASPLKRTASRRAGLTGAAGGGKPGGGKPGGGKPGGKAGGGMPAALAGPLLHRPLRARLGLRRTRLALHGPGGVAPETAAWFARIGVDLREHTPTTVTGPAPATPVAGPAAEERTP